MPTIIQLQAEAVWRAQYVPTVLSSALISPLRAYYGLGPASIGAPGDENHLYGRHRSANWDRGSIYCTNRSYGTTDARDKRGDQDWYRAVDVGITGQTLYDACHRLDELVRSGGVPGVAEWFGTFDGKVVVGWYQGHASSSDSSHLYHLHVGFWNEFANDDATMRAVFDAITGADMTPEEHRIFMNVANTISGWTAGLDAVNQTFPDGSVKTVKIDGLYKAVAAEVAKQGGGGSGPTHDELVQAAFEGAQKAEDE